MEVIGSTWGALGDIKVIIGCGCIVEVMDG